MVDWLIAVSLRNRVLVVAFFLLIGGWGYWALLTTPIDAIPDLSDNQVIVFTDWSGRSPQEVEDQVTYPLTVSLQGLPGVRVVRSSSAFGFSMINVIFEDAVDLYFARALSRTGSSATSSMPSPAWRKWRASGAWSASTRSTWTPTGSAGSGSRSRRWWMPSCEATGTWAGTSWKLGVPGRWSGASA
jgi:hypothetical protein